MIMKTDRISFAQNNIKQKPFLNSKTTDYTATSSIILAAASGFSKNKTAKAFHKFFAVLSGLLVGLHIYSVEKVKSFYKKHSD